MADKSVNRRINIWINDKQIENSYKSLNKEFRRQAALLRNMSRGSKEYNEQLKKVKSLKGALQGHREDLRGVNKSWSTLKSTFVGFTAAGIFMKVIDWGKDFIRNARKMSIEAKGIEFAFKRLEGGADALERVRKATRGMVSDLDIKKSLVNFDNFNISLEESDTLMEFLSVRATQTGQSIDYLRDSLVEGLSKESKLRIDNLGISAKELNEELEKTPNFVQAVSNIAKREIAEAGNILDEAANSQSKWNATFENFMLEFGSEFLEGVTSRFYNLSAGIVSSIVPLKQAGEEIEDQRLNMNLLANEALNVNTTQERRKELIIQLKTEYPDYLKSIDAEKTSNEELTIAIENANEMLLNKIELSIREERINSIAQKTAKARVNKIDAETELNKNLIKINEEFRLGVDLTTGSLEDQYDRIIQAAKDNNITGNQNWISKILIDMKQYDAAHAISQMSASDTEKSIMSLIDAHASYTIKSNRSKEATEDYNSALQDEIPLINQLRAEMEGYNVSEDPAGENGAITRMKELFQNSKSIGLDVLDFENWVDNELLNAEEAFQKNQLKIKEKGAKAQLADNKAYAKQQLANDQALKQAKIQIALSTASILISASNLVGQSGQEMTDFQKGLALAQIAIDTGLAMAMVPKVALEGSTKYGPFAPEASLAYQLSLTSMVLSAIVQAKRVLAPAKSPSFSETPIPAYAAGTSYAAGGLSLVGEKGPELVNIPRGSQVYTAQQSRDIANAQINVPSAIDAVQTEKGIFGGATQTGSPTFDLDNTSSSSYERWDDMISEIKLLGIKFDTYEREKQIYMSNKQFDEETERIGKIKNLRNLN